MIRFWLLFVLFVGAIFVWVVPVHQGLTVSFLDVGQGDSIFIESPTGVQVLIDGGIDAGVLREIGTRMPFWDRSLDVVIATHPDKDHIGGLSDVFERYDVKTFVESGVENDTSPTVALMRAVDAENGVNRVVARRGMRLLLGGGAYTYILFPDRDVPTIETNTGSIVMRLVYGETEFMLTGDSPQAIEKYLVSLDGDTLQSDVLKAGHHGSKTSSSYEFVEAVNPQYVIFSRGCDNTYGHPASEVIARFQELKISTLDTCEKGTITFESNGKTLRITER